jgi:hypothetical protein
VTGIDREAIYRVLKRYGIQKAYRNLLTDPTDFAIFLELRDFRKVNVSELTTELMKAVPHTKIWVTKRSDKFETVGL